MHRESITNFANESFSHEDGNWRGSSGSFQGNPELILGHGQRKPNYHMTYSKYGDLFLECTTTRSLVEMRVRSEVKIVNLRICNFYRTSIAICDENFAFTGAARNNQLSRSPRRPRQASCCQLDSFFFVGVASFFGIYAGLHLVEVD